MALTCFRKSCGAPAVLDGGYWYCLPVEYDIISGRLLSSIPPSVVGSLRTARRRLILLQSAVVAPTTPLSCSCRASRPLATAEESSERATAPVTASAAPLASFPEPLALIQTWSRRNPNRITSGASSGER